MVPARVSVNSCSGSLNCGGMPALVMQQQWHATDHHQILNITPCHTGMIPPAGKRLPRDPNSIASMLHCLQGPLHSKISMIGAWLQRIMGGVSPLCNTHAQAAALEVPGQGCSQWCRVGSPFGCDIKASVQVVDGYLLYSESIDCHCSICEIYLITNPKWHSCSGLSAIAH